MGDVDVAEYRRRYLEREAARRRGEAVPRYDHAEVVVEPGATGKGLADQRAVASAPYVRAVRERVFGSPEPPFRSMAARPCQRWEAARLAGRLDPDADAQLDEAERVISHTTGFRARDVYVWMLTGTRPRLPRAILSVRGVREVLPDGTTLQRKWATLTVNAPITEPEMRRAWRRLNAAWREPNAGPDFAAMVSRPRKTPGLTETDARILRLVNRLPDATWAQRADAWRREHSEAVTPNALAVRYHRARKKLSKLERLPSQED
ncbi:MAG: hypothetical protein ACYTDU_18525 [Planctomycetota bacterium]|jgi:hypothetical protein